MVFPARQKLIDLDKFYARLTQVSGFNIVYSTFIQGKYSQESFEQALAIQVNRYHYLNTSLEFNQENKNIYFVFKPGCVVPIKVLTKKNDTHVVFFC